MLFRQSFWAGLADGSVTVAFRRWKRPTVKTGGRQTTPAGVLAIDHVVETQEREITEADARRAGFADREALLAELAGRAGQLYRIEFHLAGADPRVALRERSALTPDDVAELDRRLSRVDGACPHGPWTGDVLGLIADRPGVRAGDLAEAMGRERLAFKADVRKLKALGLTESLPVGYRLSPRGEAWLSRERK